MGIIDLAQLLGALGLGSIIPWAWRFLARLLSNAADHEQSSIERLQDLVDALRRALDKGRLREDALAQVLGVLIFGLKGIENLSPGMADAIERAIEILEKVQDQLRQIHASSGDAQ